MGVKLAALAAAGLVASTPAGYLQGRQAANGGFVEPTGSSGPQLTAWAALGLKAAGANTGRALDYLAAHEGELTETTDVELVAMAESALGRKPDRLLTRIHSAQRSSGAIGPTVNSTMWGILALRQAGLPAPRGAVRFVLRKQARSGGWSWYAGGSPDSNDTAAAIQAATTTQRKRTANRPMPVKNTAKNLDTRISFVSRKVRTKSPGPASSTQSR